MANTNWTDLLNLIVPNGVLKNSSDVFVILDPDVGGAATFSVPLSANGLLPATHWGARTPLQWPTYNALTTMSTVQFLNYVNALAAQRGREQLASATAFKNTVVIDESTDFWAFVAANNLQPIQSEDELM